MIKESTFIWIIEIGLQYLLISSLVLLGLRLILRIRPFNRTDIKNAALKWSIPLILLSLLLIQLKQETPIIVFDSSQTSDTVLTAHPPWPEDRIASNDPVSLSESLSQQQVIEVVEADPSGHFMLGLSFLPFIWLLLTIVIWTNQVWKYHASIQKIGKREPVLNEEYITLLEQLTQKAAYNGKVRLSTSQGILSPMLINRHEICLPLHALKKLDKAQIESILAHELAHIVRKDFVWNVFILLNQGLFFFQPMHRWLFREIRKSNELLCDQWASRHIRDPLILADSLLLFASWFKSPRSYFAHFSGIRPQSSELSKRVQQIIHFNPMKKHPNIFRRLGILLISVLSLVLWLIPNLSLANILDNDGAVNDWIYVYTDSHSVPLVDHAENESLNENVNVNEEVDRDFIMKMQHSLFEPNPVEWAPSSLVIPSAVQIPANEKKPSRKESSIASIDLKKRQSPPDRVLIDWNIPTNRNHPVYRVARFWNQKKLQNMYRVNVQMNRVNKRLKEKGHSPIITNQGENSSLIFTVEKNGHIFYDTLINYVDARPDFLGMGKRSRGMRARWTNRARKWQNRIDWLGEWAAAGYPTMKSQKRMGKLPMNNSLQLGDDQIDLVLYPKESYGAFSITIYTQDGKQIYKISESSLLPGSYAFKWKYEQAPKGEYLIFVQMEEHFWIYPFRT